MVRFTQALPACAIRERAALGRLLGLQVRPRLRRYLDRRWSSLDPAAREDCLQDVCLRILARSARGLGLPRSWSALWRYLCVAADNRARDVLRRAPRELSVDPRSLDRVEVRGAQDAGWWELRLLLREWAARPPAGAGPRLRAHLARLCRFSLAAGRLPATHEIRTQLSVPEYTASRLRSDFVRLVRAHVGGL